MSTEKTSLSSASLLWFGAAVSIAEILTGAAFAPLGLVNGIIAIIAGHVIGCLLMYLAGLIGANSGLSSMQSSRISFGDKGSYLFSVLNVLQLVGWTAVMIIGGAKALNVITIQMFQFNSELLWCALIGALIILWVAVGVKNLGKLSAVAVGCLFALCVILAWTIFGSGMQIGASPDSPISFGNAMELAAVMPLSWLPLIADYTRQAKKPKTATLVSTLTYFVGSCFMYIIGMGGALYMGTSDISQILLGAGLGLVGMYVVVFSTVTTTFLDVYSAGISVENIFQKISVKWTAITVCVVGALLAMFTPIEQYENFLTLIGSVFAPMSAILITDFFILKNREIKTSLHLHNLILWAVGFALYRWFLYLDLAIGSTFPIIIIVSALCILVHLSKRTFVKKTGNTVMFEDLLTSVRTGRPLVHNITNYVTVNDCANALLACGASPIMADDLGEVSDITSICNALVINIGTLNARAINAMLLAGKTANELGRIVVLDPVGAGASSLRSETAKKLLSEINFSVIRGNMSEIKAIYQGSGDTQGVDASDLDTITKETLPDAVSMARELAAQTGAVIVITGAIDVIADSENAFLVRNGHPMMSQITGTGCMLSALVGAFCAANPDDLLRAATTAVAAMGLCGELAQKKTKDLGRGTASMCTYLIDSISTLDARSFRKYAKIEGAL